MAVQLIAQQQPVATDLRIVVTALHMASSLERMGDLAEHVAKVARLRYPQTAVPAEARATIVEMGQLAERIVAKAGSIIAAKGVDGARTCTATTTRWTASTARSSRCSSPMRGARAPRPPST